MTDTMQHRVFFELKSRREDDGIVYYVFRRDDPTDEGTPICLMPAHFVEASGLKDRLTDLLADMLAGALRGAADAAGVVGRDE